MVDKMVELKKTAKNLTGIFDFFYVTAYSHVFMQQLPLDQSWPFPNQTDLISYHTDYPGAPLGCNKQPMVNALPISKPFIFTFVLS